LARQGRVRHGPVRQRKASGAGRSKIRLALLPFIGQTAEMRAILPLLLSISLLVGEPGRSQDFPKGLKLTPQAGEALRGYTYDLPQGWSLKAIPDARFRVAFGRVTDGNPGSIIVDDIRRSGLLAEFENEVIRGLPKKFSEFGATDFKVLGIGAFETASHMMGYRVVTSVARSDGGVSRQSYYFFKLSDEKMVSVICSVVDKGATYDAIFDQIMRTFRVTK
jgi:hypothetical protein